MLIGFCFDSLMHVNFLIDVQGKKKVKCFWEVFEHFSNFRFFSPLYEVNASPLAQSNLYLFTHGLLNSY